VYRVGWLKTDGLLEGTDRYKDLAGRVLVEMVRLEDPWVLHFKMYGFLGFFQISINLPLLNVWELSPQNSLKATTQGKNYANVTQQTSPKGSHRRNSPQMTGFQAWGWCVLTSNLPWPTW